MSQSLTSFHMTISAIIQTESNRNLTSCVLFSSFDMEPFQSFGARSLGLTSKVVYALRCTCTKNLIEISFGVSVTNKTLDDLLSGLIPFLLHFESYLV